MNRTERLYKINELLRAHKVVSFATLLAKVEASRSTLKRDLKYLSERLNNPIAHHRDLGGYRIETTQVNAGRPQELPGLWFSPTEIHALLTMQQLLAGLDADGVLATHIAPLMDRLNALLGSESNSEATELRQRVRIIRLALRKRPHIACTARGSGNSTERDISPLRLPYTDHRELIMDILKHGAHCEVLGPPRLRRVVGDEAKRLGEKYF